MTIIDITPLVDAMVEAERELLHREAVGAYHRGFQHGYVRELDGHTIECSRAYLLTYVRASARLNIPHEVTTAYVVGFVDAVQSLH